HRVVLATGADDVNGHEFILAPAGGPSPLDGPGATVDRGATPRAFECGEDRRLGSFSFRGRPKSQAGGTAALQNNPPAQSSTPRGDDSVIRSASFCVAPVLDRTSSSNCPACRALMRQLTVLTGRAASGAAGGTASSGLPPSSLNDLRGSFNVNFSP